MDFPFPVARDSVAVSFNELVDPKIGGIAFGISFLCCVEAEIISGNVVYPMISTVLPEYGRHIG